MSYMKDYAIDLENENKELKENMKNIYEMISELYDYVENDDLIEKQYILEQLASIQNQTK